MEGRRACGHRSVGSLASLEYERPLLIVSKPVCEVWKECVCVCAVRAVGRQQFY